MFVVGFGSGIAAWFALDSRGEWQAFLCLAAAACLIGFSLHGRAGRALGWIAVSDRRLQRGCQPRWLKLDSQALHRTGGVAIYLGKNPWVDKVADRVGAYPWAETTQ